MYSIVRSTEMPTDTELVTLHRYYIWANKFRTHFDKILAEGTIREPNALIWFADETGLFLSYWYASLYVVVEGWDELGCRDDEIDGLLTSPNVEHLRRYRNGVCHFQRQYLDDRFIELMSSPNSVEWVRRLNMAFGRYFLTELTRRRVSREGLGDMS
ncbi:MAG: hypothetical protein HY278_11610 [candidate division NC10 bacterium]|nr:hypothetical protein [candidate division NC10 bacterium]